MRWPWRQKEALEEARRVAEEREQKTIEIRRAFFNEMMKLESIVDRLEDEVSSDERTRTE